MFRFGRFGGRYRNPTVGLVALAVGAVVLLWGEYKLISDRRAAKRAEIVACSSEPEPAHCQARVEANTKACFRATYTPARSGGRYSPKTPAFLDQAGFRACVRSSPEEWEQARREGRQQVREEERKNSEVLK